MSDLQSSHGVRLGFSVLQQMRMWPSAPLKVRLTGAAGADDTPLQGD